MAFASGSSAKAARSLGTGRQSAEDISKIFDTIGKNEQARQDRQQLTRVSNAIAGGASTIEAIKAAADKEPEFDSGIAGMFQKFNSRMRPEAGRGGISTQIDQATVSQKLQEIFSGVSQEERTQGERVKLGVAPRASTTAASRPTNQTPVEKDFDRDIKVLNNEKSAPAQRNLARNRLRKNPNLGETTETDFSQFLKGKDKSKVKGATFDKAFDEKAYMAGLQQAKDAGLSAGFSEKSVQANFDTYWDAEANKEDPEGFGRAVVPRTDFKGRGNPERQRKAEGNRPIVESDGAGGSGGIPRAGGSKAKAEETFAKEDAEKEKGGGKLDLAGATKLLQEFGGDKAKARSAATERGYTF